MKSILCWLGKHAPACTDPTGGDPFFGGPVLIRVCRSCGVELPDA